MFSTPTTHTAPLLVPTLQAPTWDSRGIAVHQPLVNGPSEWIPTLTFADDAPTTRQLRTSGDPEELRRLASANLRKLPYQLGVMQEADGPPFPMAVIEGHEYAAEQVLNPEAMRRVATQLGAKNLVVGVPRRGVLVAVDAELDKNNMSFFLHFVSAQFFRANSGPISPVGLLVYDGIVCGVAAGLEESGRADAEVVPEIPVAVDVVPGDAHVALHLKGPNLDQVSAAGMGQLMRTLLLRKLTGDDRTVDVHVHLDGIPCEDHEIAGFRHYVEQTLTSQPAQLPPLGRIRMFVDGQEQQTISDGVPPELLQVLGLAPFAVFCMVAAADGELDQAEVEALRGRLLQCHPLFMTAIQTNGLHLEQAIARLMANGQVMLGVLQQTGEQCRAHLPDLADTLLGDLATLAADIGAARDGGAPGEAEQRAIAMVDSLLGR